MSVSGTGENPRREPIRTLSLGLLVTLIVAAVALATGYLLYRDEIEDEGDWLMGISRVQARAIETVVAEFPEGPPRADDGLFLATIRNAIPLPSERAHRLGLALFSPQGDSLALVAAFQDQARVPVDDLRTTEPLLTALHAALAEGRPSTVVLADGGRGKFLSVMTPVRFQDRSLILGAFLPLSEVRGRFLGNMVAPLAVAALLAALGGLILHWATKPLLRNLRAEEEWSKRIFKDVAAPMFVTAPDGAILEANEAGAELFRVPREELLGRNVGNFYRDQEQRRRLLEALERDGQVRGMELTLRAADGSEVTCLATVRVREGPGAESREFESFLTDITDRKEAEEALRKSEARYFNLFQHAPDMLLSVDPGTGVIRACNRAALQRTGYDREEILGRPFMEFVAPESSDAIRRSWDEVLEVGAAEDVEGKVLRKDGSTFPVSANALAVRADDGSLLAVRLSMRDISARKEMEVVLAEERDRIRLYLETVEVALVALDSTGRIEMINRKGSELLGRPAEELMGRDWFTTAVPSDHRDEVRGVFERVIAGEIDPPPYFENPVLTASGGTRLVAWSNSFLRAPDGSVTGSLSSGSDITLLRESERALEASQLRLRRLYQSVQAGVILVGTGGEILEANDVAREVFARIRSPSGDGDGSFDSTWEMVDEDGRAIHLHDRPGMHTLRTGAPVRNAVRGLRAEAAAETRWLLINSEPTLDEESRVSEVVVTFQDITELKHTETALRESRETAQRYLDQAEVMLLALDRDGRIEMINRKGCEILERSETELLGSDWFETALPEADRPGVRKIFQQLLEGHPAPVEHSEGEIMTASGERRLIAWHNTPLTGPEGKAKGTFSSGTDITAQRRAELALRESIEWHDAIFEGSRDAIFISDEASRLVSVNRAAEEMTGYPKNQLLKMRIPDLHENVDLQAYELHHDRIMGGADTLSEAPILRRDGTKVDVEFNNRLLVIGGSAYMHSVARDVSERKSVERALREVEERHRAVLATSPDQIVLLDRDLRVEFMNFPPPGLELDEIQGVPLPRLVREADRDQVDATLRGVLETGRVGVYETRHQSPDGATTHFQARIRRRMLGDRPAGLVVVSRDVTRQKMMEESLKESEARYRILFNQMTEGFAVHEMVRDEEGHPVDYRFLEVNPAFEKLTGLKAGDVVGHTVREILPEADPEWIEAYNRVTRTGKPKAFYAPARSLNAHYHLSAFRPREDQVAVTFRDITEQVNTQRALRESEKRFRSVFQNSPLGIVLAATGGELLGVNPSFCETLGYSEEEILQMGMEALSHPDDEEPARTLLSRSLKGEIPGYRVERRFIHREGGTIWCRVTASTVRDERGRVAYAIGLMEDISKSRQAQEDLRASEARLRALATRLDEVREEERAALARELHDELGQLLTIIRMDLAMLGEDLSEVGDDFQDRISRIIDITDGGVELVRGLSSQLNPPVLEVMGLGPAIQWLAEEHRGRTDARFHLDIQELPRPIPKPLAKTAFRIVQESLTNVLRHANAANVRIGVKAEDGILHIEVEDDGRGIPREKLFSPSSLGLTGMRERARSRGATVQITDSGSGGTLVRLQIEIPSPTPEE